MNSAQMNSGMRCMVMPAVRMLMMVVMKLIAPRIDEMPVFCRRQEIWFEA